MEKDREYIPRPVNTEHVQLPEDLISLTEKIAENIHNVWAYGRMQEGWRSLTRNCRKTRRSMTEGRPWRA